MTMTPLRSPRLRGKKRTSNVQVAPLIRSPEGKQVPRFFVPNSVPTGAGVIVLSFTGPALLLRMVKNMDADAVLIFWLPKSPVVGLMVSAAAGIRSIGATIRSLIGPPS